MPADYQSTARALALPIDDDSETSGDHTATSPLWRRPHRSSATFRRSLDASSTYRDRALFYYDKLQRQADALYNRLSPIQLAALSIAGITAIVTVILFLVYQERIFAWFKPLAENWKHVNGGFLLLWLATFLVSFPPMIGYSTCVTLSGFIYGVGKGWLIVSTATIVGSTCSFLASRTVLSSWVQRLLANDTRFAALSLTLKHDGLKILCMIRLCPLPYSLSNGAIATFPTIKWTSFALATAIATPKLVIHVFIGSRIADIAGGKMDGKTKAINYASMAFGGLIGLVTGVLIYRQTKRRAAELERKEAEGSLGPGRGSAQLHRRSGSEEYSDDPDEAVAGRGSSDAINLGDHLEDEEEDARYRDLLSDDEEERGKRTDLEQG